MTGRRAVAISTTGHQHRLGFLETSVRMWDAALGPGDSLFVTVDGTNENARQVAAWVNEITGSVFQVGRPLPILSARRSGKTYRAEQMMGTRRLGVAVNKNTGLELMMDNTKAEHLFLCDDDTWPLYSASLDKHTGLMTDQGVGHSMVCWGKSRLVFHHESSPVALWNWPRGCMLYAHRSVIEKVGGFDERMRNAHEHAEFSRRIHQHGFTTAPFVTPISYATRKGQGAAALWHCEDMARPGEVLASLGARRDAITSIDKAERDWDAIHEAMDDRDGNLAFVPYSAHGNDRASAILCSDLSSQGGCAVEPASRGSSK